MSAAFLSPHASLPFLGASMPPTHSQTPRFVFPSSFSVFHLFVSYALSFIPIMFCSHWLHLSHSLSLQIYLLIFFLDYFFLYFLIIKVLFGTPPPHSPHHFNTNLTLFLLIFLFYVPSLLSLLLLKFYPFFLFYLPSWTVSMSPQA